MTGSQLATRGLRSRVRPLIKPHPTLARAISIAKWTAGSIFLFAFLFGSGLVAVFPLLVRLIIGMAVVTTIARRWPAAAMLALVVGTAASGSLQAYTPVGPGLVIYPMLIGLWLAAAVGFLRARRRELLVPIPGVFLLVAYAAIGFVGVVTSDTAFQSLRAFLSSTAVMTLVVVVAYGDWSPAVRRRVAQGVAVLAVLVGAYASLRWVTGPAAAEQRFVQEAGTYGSTVAGSGGQKVFGSFANGPALGAWTATMLPFLAAVSMYGRGRQRLFAIGIPFLAIGLFASGNRGSLVGAVVGASVVAVLATVSHARFGTRFAKAGMVLVALTLCGFVLFPAVMDDNPAKTARYSNILHPSRDHSFNARLTKWKAAMSDSAERTFGHGQGTASPGYRRLRFPSPEGDNVDSAYVQVAYEQGIPVLALFVVTLLALLVGLARRALTATSAEAAVIGIGAAGALGAFAVLCAVGQFNYDVTSLAVWLLVGIGLAPFATVNGITSKA